MTDQLPSHPKKTKRTHSPEFKAKIVALCQEGSASRAAIARRFDLNDNLVHKWCVAAKHSGGAMTAPDFVKVPMPSVSTPDMQTVVFELPTRHGVIKVHWPINAMAQSVSWLKQMTV